MSISDMLNRFLCSALALAAILTMCSCQSTQKSPGRSGPPGDPDALLAEAREHPQSTRNVRLRLEAAQAYVSQSEYSLALDALASLDPDKVRANLANDIHRVRAQALFALDSPGEAEAALMQLSEWQGDDYLAVAAICEAQDHYRCAADGYIQAALAFGLDAPELPADIHDRIWQTLGQARQGPAMFTHRYHHGWWLLQQSFREAGTITRQIQAWREWRAAFPSHPASIRPPQVLTRLESYTAPRIALLLPLSGPLSGAGRAARDGFVAAYLSESASDKPVIRVYDSAAGDIAQLWERVLADRAEVVVGPLLKPEVEQFADLTTYARIPRLVLNYLDEAPEAVKPAPGFADVAPLAPSAPLFQFGIAIEDEAASLVDRVLEQGYERLLIVRSEQRWAARAHTEFLQRWPYPVAEAVFTNIKALTEAVGDAMQVTQSTERKTELENILGARLEFLPRAREDLEAVVALTSNVESRALVPALRFHFADHLPVFATSQTARSGPLKDLAGFQLTEMPLFSAPNTQQHEMEQAFQVSRSAFAELYALGFDAYRAATWLPVLQGDSRLSLAGASGYLWLDGEGRIHRDLDIAIVGQDGRLQLPAP